MASADIQRRCGLAKNRMPKSHGQSELTTRHTVQKLLRAAFKEFQRMSSPLHATTKAQPDASDNQSDQTIGGCPDDTKELWQHGSIFSIR